MGAVKVIGRGHNRTILKTFHREHVEEVLAQEVKKYSTQLISGWSVSYSECYSRAVLSLNNGVEPRFYQLGLKNEISNTAQREMNSVAAAAVKKVSVLNESGEIIKLMLGKDAGRKFISSNRCLNAYKAFLLGLFSLVGRQQRLSDLEWEPLKVHVLKDSGYQCEICSSAGVELHVHHIIPLSSCGTNNLKNLVSLCRRCHERQHDHSFD